MVIVINSVHIVPQANCGKNISYIMFFSNLVDCLVYRHRSDLS